MKRSVCPRCNEPVPDRHPVHFVCFLERSAYWLVGVLLIVLVAITIIVYQL